MNKLTRLFLVLSAVGLLAGCGVKSSPIAPSSGFAVTSLDWVPDANYPNLEVGLDYDPSILVAIFNSKLDSAPKTLEAIAKEAGVTYLQSVKLADLGTISIACGYYLAAFDITGKDPQVAAQALKRAADVVTAGQYSVYGASPKTNPIGSLQAVQGLATRVATSWGYAAVNPSPKKANVPVSVIDTGVNKTAGLIPNISVDFTQTNTLDEFINPLSGLLGHGTGVANIIGAPANIGVAGGSPVLSIKAFNQLGKGDDMSIIPAICFAASRSQVINISGGTLLNSKTLELTVDDVIQNGVVVVAAAGNTRGPSYVGTKRFALPNFPAAYSPLFDGLISVGSINQKFAASSFETASKNNQPDLVAPGEAITTYTADGNVKNQFEGTSFAAPYVSGAVSQLLSQNPSLSPSKIESILKGSANRAKCTSTKGYECGAGLLDISAALAIAP